MRSVHHTSRTLAYVAAFGVTFAFVESAVVVYLRALDYPDGFALPLRTVPADRLLVEIAREASTMVMLCCVAALAGRNRWERVGYFLVAFGVWDIFYYVWLKVLLGWPASMFDWDVLFLIPVPWIGPVVAPLAIAAAMTGCGAAICLRTGAGGTFRPRLPAWVLGAGGTVLLLYSFVRDTDATLRGAPPHDYSYGLLGLGLLTLLSGFFMTWKSPPRRKP